MYTFIIIDLYNSVDTLRLSYVADILLSDPEHIAERIDYWDNIPSSLFDEETCIALIVEEE